jgi:3-methyladenine DNA glycosylase/8-oxoguanine DNA glycosylase
VEPGRRRARRPGRLGAHGVGPRRRVAALAAETDPTPDELLALPGIGPWTAGYVALRRGDPDVWLPTDAGVLRALRALCDTPDPERWRPYRSYAVMHLWAVC